MNNKKFAFIFPGQGSQKIGMLADVAKQFAVVEETFAEGSAVLGYNMWDIVQNGKSEQLNTTEQTQSILLTASVALWRVWQQCHGHSPQWLAGHSLGEFSALVCANSLAFTDAVSLVRDRGRFMQAAVPMNTGGMAAVLGLTDDTVAALCADCADQGVVEAVNFNAPGQLVIAGENAALAKAITLCKQAGAKKVVTLPVSAPFHTSLMKSAGEQLAVRMADLTIKAPAIPVLHNVGAQMTNDPQAIKALLVEQIYSPVNWVQCVNAMIALGIDTMVECGPGKVLGGLNRRIDKSLTTYFTGDANNLEQALVAIGTR